MRKQLTLLQYRVTHEKVTERAFTGEYEKATAPGIYRCTWYQFGCIETGPKNSARSAATLRQSVVVWISNLSRFQFHYGLLTQKLTAPNDRCQN